jgi:hypothetical protein
MTEPSHYQRTPGSAYDSGEADRLHDLNAMAVAPLRWLRH